MSEPTRVDAGATLGVDIGGTKVFGVALSAEGVVIADARMPTPQSDDDRTAERGGAVANAVAGVVASLRQSIGSPEGSRVLLGVGAPGMVDRDGTLCFAPNLPSAAGTPVRCLVSERVGGSVVVVENDANCAALSEQRFGALRGVREGIIVTLGTGIGGGLVIDGEVRVGSSGFAGEVGHMIVDPAGPSCPCGRRGCWERYASGGGLGRLAREAAYAGRLSHLVTEVGGDPENVRGEDVTRAARAGDEGAIGVLDELGWWVALGLANLAAIFDLERCVIGGGLAEAGDLLLGPTRRSFLHLLEGATVRPEIDIVAAVLGERAGAIGAALVARRQEIENSS